MRLGALFVALSVVLAGAIYMIRGTEADSPEQARPLPFQPQIEGRMVSPIYGDTDHGGYFALCEYDADVRIKDGVVVDIVDGVFGNVISSSKGLRVDVGERVLGGDGVRPGGDEADLDWGAGVSVARVYRDDSGNLHTGCAPESVITYEEPVRELPLATPPR